MLIPGRVQAEDFYYQEGLETEETSDTFGGLNIGYTDQGDFADYLVAINDSGDYSISFRVASQGSGSLKLELINDTSTENIGLISTPNTGGWQNWQTISFSRYLPEGLYTLRTVSYTHLRAHETEADLVCRLLLESSMTLRIKILPILHLNYYFHFHIQNPSNLN